jgi:hypothetical protein
LRPLLQQRELLAYEQRLARRVYAYGVDVRRSAWLQTSSLGEPLMRAVDRRWRKTTEALGECLEPPSSAPPTPVMEELTSLIHQLRAATPSIRLLRPSQSGQWPILTPLATTRGGVQWLVIDVDRLTALADTPRRFVLASALAHLQCDHGPLFAAHLIAHLRGRGLGTVRRLLRPWTRVAYFSADRAGLLLTRDLPAALEVLDTLDAPEAAWVPAPPERALRRQALEDFDHADVMARVRLLSEIDPRQWNAAARKAAAASGPMGRRLSKMLSAAVRVGGRMMYTLEGGSFGPRVTDAEAPKVSAAGDARDAAPETDAEAVEAEAPTPPPIPEELPLDEALEAKIERVVAESRSVSRCDEALTRRLRLL